MNVYRIRRRADGLFMGHDGWEPAGADARIWHDPDEAYDSLRRLPIDPGGLELVEYELREVAARASTWPPSPPVTPDGD